MQYSVEDVGVNLLESITGGLYDGNLNCLREYVQNAIDSNARNIRIDFESRKNLIIEDDGLGMDEGDLKYALGIGKSQKNATQVGWRGIGIWSGIPVCHRIVIITKTINNPKLRIEISCDKIRSRYYSDKGLVDVLSEATGEIEKLDPSKHESDDEHFTIIRLEGILETQRQFFTIDKLRDFLSLTVPAPFNAENFIFAKDIQDYLISNGVPNPEINIVLNDEKIYRGPFESEIYVETFAPFTIKDRNDQPIAVGWCIFLKENKAEKWPKAGILIKKKNFTIGNELLASSYLEGLTFHHWQYGEIHVLSETIRENAPRNNFEYNQGDVQDLINRIREILPHIEIFNRYKVRVKKLKRVAGEIEKQIQDGEIIDNGNPFDHIELARKEIREFPKADFLLPLKAGMDSDITNVVSRMEKVIEASRTTEKKSEIGEVDGIEVNGISEKDLNTLYYSMRDTLFPPSALKDLRRVRKGHEKDLVISSTDIIQNLIFDRTGVTDPKFYNITRNAFGWADVTKKVPNSNQILVIDKENKALSRQFGVMVFAAYSLFINKFKHEKDRESFEWYMKASDSERIKILIGFEAIIALIYRLIEHAELETPK